jgi:archaellum biogenesis protein FlaJ (TadC family)
MADEKDIKRFQRWGLAASLGIIALFLASGMITYSGMNSTLVLAPNVLLMVVGMWLCYNMVKLFRKGDELTEAANKRMMHVNWSSLAAAIFGALAAIAQLVYSLIKGWMQGDWIFILLMACTVPLAVMVFILVRRCPTEPLFIDDMPEIEE